MPYRRSYGRRFRTYRKRSYGYRSGFRTARKYSGFRKSYAPTGRYMQTAAKYIRALARIKAKV